MNAAQNENKAALEATGMLARKFGGESLPLTVLKSQSGFYLGTMSEGQPFTRESEEYWGSDGEANLALQKGDWTQRPEL